MKSFGQIAYEAYGNSREWIRAGGDRMCQWEELLEEEVGESVQRAWQHSAESVINHYQAVSKDL
jgi:hypothetical protein